MRDTIEHSEKLYAEFWVSLGSLMRSYTAVHGLRSTQQAVIELTDRRIVVRHNQNWLELQRAGAIVNWKHFDGRTGTLRFTASGKLQGPEGEEEMDMAAESWAQGLMHE